MSADRFVKLGFDDTGWCCFIIQPGAPMISAGPIRLERGNDLRPPRMVVEVSPVVLEELQKRLELPIIEAPPLSEIEARVEALSRRQDVIDNKIAACREIIAGITSTYPNPPT